MHNSPKNDELFLHRDFNIQGLIRYVPLNWFALKVTTLEYTRYEIDDSKFSEYIMVPF
jgi:hypothetical protein